MKTGDYPPGALNDPNAPYNEPRFEDFDGQGCPECHTGVLMGVWEQPAESKITDPWQRIYTCNHCGTVFFPEEVARLKGV